MSAFLVDGLYLTTAQEREVAFVTADERLVRKRRQLPAGTFSGTTTLTPAEALRTL